MSLAETVVTVRSALGRVVDRLRAGLLVKSSVLTKMIANFLSSSTRNACVR